MQVSKRNIPFINNKICDKYVLSSIIYYNSLLKEIIFVEKGFLEIEVREAK